MDLRKLKEKAGEAFAKGRFGKAAELYADYCQQDPKDLQARVRMGDAYAKSGDKSKAVRAYQTAAEGYAKDGFLPRAIAASKLILELDPAHNGVQRMLADLYARKTGGGKKPAAAPEPAAAPSRAIDLPADPDAPAAAVGLEAGEPVDLSSELPPELQLPSGLELDRSGDGAKKAAAQPPSGGELEAPGALAPSGLELDLPGSAPKKVAAPPSGVELELPARGAKKTAAEVDLELPDAGATDSGSEVDLEVGAEDDKPSTPSGEIELDLELPAMGGATALADADGPTEIIDVDDVEDVPVGRGAAPPPAKGASPTASGPAGARNPAASSGAAPGTKIPAASASAASGPAASSSAAPVSKSPAASSSAASGPAASSSTAPGNKSPAVSAASGRAAGSTAASGSKSSDAAPESRSPAASAAPGSAARAANTSATAASDSTEEVGEDALEREIQSGPDADEPEPAEGLVVEVSPRPPRIIAPLSDEEARAAVARVQAGGLPPGMRPKKGDEQEEIFLLDRPKTPLPVTPEQAGSRIWIPSSFGQVPAARAAEAEDSSKAHRTDIQAGLATFSRFDELEMDVDSAAESLPVQRAPAPRAPLPSAVMPSFTELELEGESLLHAVETAARAGMGEGEGEAGGEEAFSIGDELVDTPAGADAGGLPKIPLFSDLSPEAFIELFERCPLRRFTARERIIEEGSLGDSFFVICAGKVNVFRSEDGVRKELASLEEGAFFGEMALLSGAPRTASVEADSDETQLLELSAQLLAQLSHRYPQVAQALKKFCRQRMLANVMAASALFRSFAGKDRRALVERFRARDVPKGSVVIQEGSNSDGLYIVLSGEVEINKGDTVLARLKEGEVFGEMSLLTKTPAAATVSASKRTSLLRLPRADFDQIISSHPQILALIAELNEDRSKQNEAVLSGAAELGDEGLLLV